jgi:hypothetical protein
MTSVEEAAFPQLLPQVRRCGEGVKNVSVAGCETMWSKVDGRYLLNESYLRNFTEAAKVDSPLDSIES